MHTRTFLIRFERIHIAFRSPITTIFYTSEDARSSKMFVQSTVRAGYVIHIRSLLVSRPTLFFEVEVLASPVKSDLSGYGYVLPRQAHCETAQLSLREAHCETAPRTIPYLLCITVAADDNAKCWESF